MNGKIRRVVTGHDANGKAIVLEDRLAPNVKTNPLRPGHISVELWKTKTMPVPVGREEPDPTEGPKVQIPEGYGIEWAMPQHFFNYTYYVYQYATSVTAAWNEAQRSDTSSSDSGATASASSRSAVFSPENEKSASLRCCIGRGSAKRVALPRAASFSTCGPPG